MKVKKSEDEERKKEIEKEKNCVSYGGVSCLKTSNCMIQDIKQIK